MTASINDKFRKANNGTLALPAQLSATKQTIDTTASLSLATGWPTDTAIDIQIYKVGTDGKVVAGSVTHWIATLSGTTLSNMTLTGGTNQAYATGDTVVLMPNPKWANDLVDGVLEEHKQDGSHGAVTATSVTTTDAITAGNGLNVTGPVSLPAGSLSTPAYGNGTVTNAKLATGAGEPGGAWQSWTPTWTNLTVGNGTVAAAYKRVGNLIFFRLTLTFGSTTSVAGNVSVSLPATSVALTARDLIAQGTAYDTSASQPYSIRSLYVNTTSMSVWSDVANAVFVSQSPLNVTQPLTWAVGDSLQLAGCYEAA